MFKKTIVIIKKFPDVILLLMLGMYSGSMVTLAYAKRHDISNLSYGDIGGMLAGVGTIGLLYVAVTTTYSWKKSNNLVHQKNALEKWYSNATELYVFLKHKVNQQYFKTYTHLDLSKIYKELDEKEQPKLEIKANTDNNTFNENKKILKSLINEITPLHAKITEYEEQLIIQLTTLTSSTSVPKFEDTFKVIHFSRSKIDTNNYQKLVSAVEEYNQKKKEFYKQALEELHK